MPRNFYHFTTGSLTGMLERVGFRVTEVHTHQPPEHIGFSWLYDMNKW